MIILSHTEQQHSWYLRAGSHLAQGPAAIRLPPARGLGWPGRTGKAGLRDRRAVGPCSPAPSTDDVPRDWYVSNPNTIGSLIESRCYSATAARVRAARLVCVQGTRSTWNLRIWCCTASYGVQLADHRDLGDTGTEQRNHGGAPSQHVLGACSDNRMRARSHIT